MTGTFPVLLDMHACVCCHYELSLVIFILCMDCKMPFSKGTSDGT